MVGVRWYDRCGCRARPQSRSRTVAQHGGDVFHLAVFNRFTDARGADPLAFIFHCGHDVHFAAVGFAELFQPLRVARRELTEAEIRATGDALRVQTEAQKVCKAAPRATLRPVQNPA